MSPLRKSKIKEVSQSLLNVKGLQKIEYQLFKINHFF